jgi:hypothetical protein
MSKEKQNYMLRGVYQRNASLIFQVTLVHKITFEIIKIPSNVANKRNLLPRKGYRQRNTNNGYYSFRDNGESNDYFIERAKYFNEIKKETKLNVAKKSGKKKKGKSKKSNIPVLCINIYTNKKIIFESISSARKRFGNIFKLLNENKISKDGWKFEIIKL